MKKIITATLLGGAIIGSLLGAAPANALVSTAEICSQLGADPSKETIVEIAVDQILAGAASEKLGGQFAIAALSTCPEHYDLIETTMAEFAEGDLT